MATSIFVFKLTPPTQFMPSEIYKTLSALPDGETSYFNLHLLSDNEISGEYVTVQTVQETFYNAAERTFEQRQVPKANIVNFSICDDWLEVWGSKSNANRLVFAISSALQNKISMNAVDISIEDIINKFQNFKVKVSKVCFEDFLFSEDIVGNFTVDLSTYGDTFSVLNKYKDKIVRMTVILPSEGMAIKMSFSSKGTVMVYRSRDAFEDDTLDLLHAILLK